MALRLLKKRKIPYFKYIIVSLIIAFPILLSKISTAGLSKEDVVVGLRIGDINYGNFSDVEGLDDLVHDHNRGETGKVYHLKFVRNFFTDPSLYLWAKDSAQDFSILRDMQLRVETKYGEVLKNISLKNAQPLSWSVEAINPAQGGFYEQVDVVVQDPVIF